MIVLILSVFLKQCAATCFNGKTAEQYIKNSEVKNAWKNVFQSPSFDSYNVHNQKVT